MEVDSEASEGWRLPGSALLQGIDGMTGQEFIDFAKQALGDRDEIADVNISTAALFVLNKVIRRVVNHPTHEWNALFRRFRTTLLSTDNVYNLPNSTDFPDIIGVKTLNGLWIEQENRPYVLTFASNYEKKELFPLTSTNKLVRRPEFYGQYGLDQFWVHPFPDVDYDARLNCYIIPRDITVNEDQPLGDSLDFTLMSGLAAELHRELISPDDAVPWERQYMKLLDEQIKAERAKSDWIPDEVPSHRYLGTPNLPIWTGSSNLGRHHHFH